MAIERTKIKAVRVADVDGNWKEFPWEEGTRYLIRDDHPYLDFLVRGPLLRPKADAKDDIKIFDLNESDEEGARWQRWDLETELARHRRFGEVDLHLKVPKGTTLRSYVIPAAILDFRDAVAMIEDIEAELGVSAAWDLVDERPERSWSRRTNRGRAITPTELIRQVREEVSAARSIRREPFVELGPVSRRGTPLAENAMVSHWASRRCSQLRDALDGNTRELDLLRTSTGREHPDGRRKGIDERIVKLTSLENELAEITNIVARLGNDDGELNTLVHPTPLFHRDHRLRLLMRAFAPLFSESISEIDAARSHFPPMFLTRLWELWGAVWLAKEFRKLGFSGSGSTDLNNSISACSWRLRRGDILLEFDFEPEPSFIDYRMLPPAHERTMPALEWAALHQTVNPDRPFLGAEEKCSPDYLIRITVGDERFLIVGDATLASPDHHKDNKPKVVEQYRRTIGWSVEGEIVRCHPMGGFVIFPPPSPAWSKFEKVFGASDCTLLCPDPQGHGEAGHRLERLLNAISLKLCHLDTKEESRG
ncbi:hypothetical protein [Sinorhizobium meliloti]|uniref:hypothetical protein n=1 Tax=Rhizobium meliloti TaxID=382 RepID=UPI0030B19CE6